jgi:transcriptional regulator with XRE-family HTH domain
MSGGAHPSDLELVAWADGDLAGAESIVIGTHIDTCPACQGLIAGLQPPLPPPASRPAAPNTEVLPGSLMEVLAARCVADPGAGQLWQLEWDGRGAVGLIVGVDADTVRVVPAEDDPHLGDAWALLLEEADSPIGLGFVLWTGLAVSVPMRVLNVLLGVVPEPVMTGVQDALAARAAHRLGAADGIGAPISSVLDERAQLVESIKRRFAELAVATWLPATAGEPVRVGELLQAAGLQATQVAEHLGLPPREVLKLVRNQRPLSPEEAARLAELLGVAPSTLGATVSIPAELVAALDRPHRRTQLRALAETAGTSEAAFRRAEALAILPMAARRTGAPDAGPDWEQLVEDRLRGR